MGQAIYAVAFLVSILMLILLIFIGYKQNITYYLLVFVAILLANVGYFTVSSAETLETAVMGNRLTYLGSIFIPILMLLCVSKLCQISVPKPIVTALLVYGVVVLYFVFSVEYRTDYYKSIALGKDNGVSYLIKEYGSKHIIYPVFLITCFVITLGVIIYALFRQKRVSHKIMLLLLIAELITLCCYFGQRIVDINIEWTAVAFVCDEILILILIRRISMYEVSESIANSLNEYSTYGYLVFDKNKRYIGCNDMAREYLPEINNQKVDTVLSKERTPYLYEKFGQWMDHPHTDGCECLVEDLQKKYGKKTEHIGSENHECLIEKEDMVLKCSLRNLYYGRRKKKIGYLIELIDDTQQQKYMKLLNNYNADLEAEVQKKTERISKMQDKMILGMADMIENRDSNTGGHIKRTSSVIRIFTKELRKYEKEYGFTKDFLNYVAKAAPMHDLGKIAVDDRILRKPGKYTPEEFEEMKKHSEKGAEIVTQILNGIEDEEFLLIAKNVAHYHHEKWNGQGYPKHLEGKDIPLEARIMALADVFDALVSKRCYKEKMDYDTAFKIIEESLGSHFDPKLGRLFLKCRPQLEEFYNGVE